MNYLGIIGLVFDVTGVVLLGVDLLRVQRKLRGDAEERLATLTDVAESAGGLDRFLKSISGDWREYEYDEGTAFPRVGTFDHESAERSFSEVKDGINGLADNLQIVARIMFAAGKSDRKTAGMSLRVTYGGLTLIVLGFAFQVLGYM